MNNNRSKPRARVALFAASGTALCVAMAPALAQEAPKPPAGTTAVDPNPYYVGVGQGFTHDSNVFRVPSGPGDIYSTTSVFGGFDQPISRQRIFGRAQVSLNRYQDETQLNNTSYDISAGADLQTIENISGNLNLGFSQHLAAPAASVGIPIAVRNVAQTERIDSLLRWGGPSLLTLEGRLGYIQVDNSAPEYISSDSRETTASLGVFYKPGEFSRVGVAARFERSRTPNAVFDPVTGSFQSNTGDGRNFDLLADYVVSDRLRANGRLSYTHQTNSSIPGADLSGVTGGLDVNWQVTAKTGVHFDVSRDAGFDTNTVTGYAAVQSGTGVTVTPVSALYENNRVTDTVGLGATYAATAKISASAQLRYSRAAFISGAAATAGANTHSTDVYKTAWVGLNYAITRAWSANCNYSYENRDVSGVIAYTYAANVVSCATQFTWR
jgi:hypothetical protein